ncbi:hypothetical protein [Prosthecochloris vibrioformis]|uniref:Uncharacterized protein n=1 Tax=Prosthecochloris vibrioformis TaxID=1098 RepID=A0A5C4S3K1_PROVB|nr:hypothetical protein [Prosthecochloris vibrioformis]TNJ37371.1 hypothetical protein FGF68_03925 [Prosthecochloris vibrioformis]
MPRSEPCECKEAGAQNPEQSFSTTPNPSCLVASLVSARRPERRTRSVHTVREEFEHRSTPQSQGAAEA